jgi:hypothetical protein
MRGGIMDKNILKIVLAGLELIEKLLKEVNKGGK